MLDDSTLIVLITSVIVIFFVFLAALIFYFWHSRRKRKTIRSSVGSIRSSSKRSSRRRSTAVDKNENENGLRHSKRSSRASRRNSVHNSQHVQHAGQFAPPSKFNELQYASTKLLLQADDLLSRDNVTVEVGPVYEKLPPDRDTNDPNYAQIRVQDLIEYGKLGDDEIADMVLDDQLDQTIALLRAGGEGAEECERCKLLTCYTTVSLPNTDIVWKRCVNCLPQNFRNFVNMTTDDQKSRKILIKFKKNGQLFEQVVAIRHNLKPKKK